MATELNYLRELARFVADIRFEVLPTQTVEHAQLVILDYLSASMAGWRVNPVFNQAACRVFGGMGGTPESTVLFSNLKLPAGNAAFVNAGFGHGADLDDGNRKAQGHPAVVVVPTALAMAQKGGNDGTDVIAAIVAGYEIYTRISTAMMPELFLRGFHGTGLIGALASAAVAAKLIGLDADGIHNAISLAAVSAAGLLHVSVQSAMVKPVNPANAVRVGITAALMVQQGVVAPQEPLLGERGFFHMFVGDAFCTEELLQNLGKPYLITQNYFKLYAACRHAHAMVDCAIQLCRQGVKAEQIEHVRLRVYPMAFSAVCQYIMPQNEDEAKFSMTYSTAIALQNGAYRLNDLFSATAMTLESRELIGRMELVSDSSMEDRARGVRGARLEVMTKQGEAFAAQVDLPKGDPENPVTCEDLRVKLSDCAQGLFSEEQQNRIYELCMSIPALEDMEMLAQALCIASVPAASATKR